MSEYEYNKTQLITFSVDVTEAMAKFFVDLLNELDCVAGYECEPDIYTDR